MTRDETLAVTLHPIIADDQWARGEARFSIHYGNLFHSLLRIADGGAATLGGALPAAASAAVEMGEDEDEFDGEDDDESSEEDDQTGRQEVEPVPRV